MAEEKRDIAAFDELITNRPEIQAFDRELEEGYLMGQWHAERTFLQKEPQPTGIPYLWKWSFMEEMLTKAASSMDELTMARRALMFINPGFAPHGGTTLTLRAGMQLIRQGEVAWAHQHTPQALRFVVEGSEDAYTGVNGEQIPFLDNDLILTPMWSWHHHESNAKDRVIWIDAVDTPFVRSLNCLFSEEHSEAKYERKRLTPSAVVAQETIRPTGSVPGGSKPSIGFPLVYRWQDTEKVLDRMEGSPGDANGGVVLEYTNPMTGGATLPTMDCGVHMLRKGEKTRSLRKTWATLHYVVSGEGTTEAGEGQLRWGPRDVFVVPNWCWYSHRNEGKDRAVLFTLSDMPIYRAFGLDREESR